MTYDQLKRWADAGIDQCVVQQTKNALKFPMTHTKLAIAVIHRSDLAQDLIK